MEFSTDQATRKEATEALKALERAEAETKAEDDKFQRMEDLLSSLGG